MTIITDDWIDRAEAEGACSPSLLWLREEPRAIDELCSHSPSWALWACRLDGWAALLTPERIDACAVEAPWDALEFASALLTPERLDACAAEAPREALMFVAASLTPERLDACAATRQWAALEFASALLTPARIDACAAEEPWDALEFASALLTPERLTWCQLQVNGIRGGTEGE